MNISIKYKAAILIAATELLLLGILLFSNLHYSRENLEQQLDTQARSTAELIGHSATDALLAFDLAQLQNQLDSVIGSHNIKFVSIVDHRGQTLARAGRPPPAVDAVNATYRILVADTLFGEVRLSISRAQAEAALKKTTRNNFLIVMIEILLVAIISISLGWYLTRNLSTLINGTKAIEQGDFGIRVPVESKDEIGVLATHFNHMAARLQESIEELEAGRKRFRDVADHTSDWLWETGQNDQYTYASNQIEHILGYAPEQALGASLFQFMLANDAKRLRALFYEYKAVRRPFYGFEYQALRKDGAVVVLETNGVPVVDKTGKLSGYRGVTRDITRRKEDAARLVYLSEHDPLTGLLSRHKFLELLEDEVRFSNHTNVPVTLLLIDIDSFKLVNDTHGHMAGDTLLKMVSELLVNEARQFAQVARLGGDEFGILLRGKNAEEGKTLAKRILINAQSTPLAIDNEPIHISACIGIASCPQDGTTGEELMAHGDAALIHAKNMGHNRYYVSTGTDRDIDVMRKTVNWRSVIHHAIEEGRLVIEYQPIVSTSFRANKQKYEALVRIRDTSGELISAHEFIDTAEMTGQINNIDKWVITEVTRLLAQPQNRNLCISVNISGKSLETLGFCENCHDIVSQADIDPAQLIFEITESTAIAEMGRTESFIMKMKRLGYRFSLDDFGVGFSSFSYLKHLPVDQIKIDGSFIRNLETSYEDQVFVDAIVRVAKGLGLETVAEFVDSESTTHQLVKMGVDYLQGHYIGLADRTPTWPDMERLTRPPTRRW